MKNIFIRTDMFLCDSHKDRAVRDILDKAREEIISVLGTEIYLDVRIQKGDPFCYADEMPDEDLTDSYASDSERLSKAGVGFPPLCKSGKILPSVGGCTFGGDILERKLSKIIEIKMKESPKERKERLALDKELDKAIGPIE